METIRDMKEQGQISQADLRLGTVDDVITAILKSRITTLLEKKAGSWVLDQPIEKLEELMLSYDVERHTWMYDDENNAIVDQNNCVVLQF